MILAAESDLLTRTTHPGAQYPAKSLFRVCNSFIVRHLMLIGILQIQASALGYLRDVTGRDMITGLIHSGLLPFVLIQGARVGAPVVSFPISCRRCCADKRSGPNVTP